MATTRGADPEPFVSIPANLAAGFQDTRVQLEFDGLTGGAVGACGLKVGSFTVCNYVLEGSYENDFQCCARGDVKVAETVRPEA